MVDGYRIFGSELSPYSVKVRSYFRYKSLPYRWIVRNAETEAEYQQYAKVPIIPLVVTPSGESWQDSTPIMERIDTLQSEPATHPGDPVARFISILVEEFGDEWANKWMFHFRWARDVDQLSAAGRIARRMATDASDAEHARTSDQIRARMVGRVFFVGSSAKTAQQIEGSFSEALQILDTHLATRPFLFGARPAFGDFGLYAQLYECWTDPTAGARIEASAPNVLDWLHRMLWPRAEGEFETWSRLEPTLLPLLQRIVGPLFMRWTVANAAAIEAGSEEFSVALNGREWTQRPQKYHAKSLQVLREKYAQVRDKPGLDAVLERANCLHGLRP